MKPGRVKRQFGSIGSPFYGAAEEMNQAKDKLDALKKQKPPNRHKRLPVSLESVSYWQGGD
jgi:hypothetical protein